MLLQMGLKGLFICNDQLKEILKSTLKHEYLLVGRNSSLDENFENNNVDDSVMQLPYVKNTISID